MVNLLIFILFRIGIVVAIFVPGKEDIKCLINVSLIFIFSVVKIIVGVWTLKNWSFNLYEFSSDLLLGLLYILCY